MLETIAYAQVVKRSAGIYVEVSIRTDLETVWRLTQTPAQHQRWDLRFTEIHYLPRASDTAPQRFLYETRIGFGLAIRGTGESMAQRASSDGAVSSLRFASDDPKSLIRNGSGYWRYVPADDCLRFFTWYDYEVRFGALGRLLDRVFRPLMGWATAWSFDRLRRWIEHGQAPELSMRLAVIHAVARLTVAFIWIWHGLVPKLLFRNPDERLMLTDAGLPGELVTFFGVAEILFGVLMLIAWRANAAFAATVVLMILAIAGVAVSSPRYLTAAFNPVTLNLSMIAISVVGWLAQPYLPTATRCLRAEPTRTV